MCLWSSEICVMLLWGGERVCLRVGFDCVIAGWAGCCWFGECGQMTWCGVVEKILGI